MNTVIQELEYLMNLSNPQVVATAKKALLAIEHTDKMLRGIRAATDLETARRRAWKGLHPESKDE